MKRAHTVFVSFALAAALAAPWARAESAEEAALIEQGVALRERGEDEAALGSFSRAWALGRGAHARAQMALAEYALGRWLEAEAHLREALAVTDDPWIDAHRAELTGQMGEIVQHIGALEVTSDAPGTELWLAGRRIGALPLAAPLRLPEGAVTLEARAPGYHPRTREVVVTHGAPGRVSFTLERVIVPVRGRNPLGLVVAGVGGAAVVAGAVAWFVAGGMCHPEAAGCGVAPASVDDVRALETVANVGLWGGLGLVAVGTALYVLRIPSSGDSASRRAAVVIGPGSLQVVGSF